MGKQQSLGSYFFLKSNLVDNKDRKRSCFLTEEVYSKLTQQNFNDHKIVFDICWELKKSSGN